jgi:hypothetical protein
MSPIISKDVWITREGKQVEIRSMASSHLLSAIHFIERNRFMNAAECYTQEGLNHPDKMAMVEYYLDWPIQYDTMIAEAQRRKLINRGVEGLVKSK